MSWGWLQVEVGLATWIDTDQAAKKAFQQREQSLQNHGGKARACVKDGRSCVADVEGRNDSR